MKSILFVSLLVFSLACYANDQIIKEMSHQTNLSESEIREHYINGCESGVQLYMNICMLYHFYEADWSLNENYRELMHRLTSTTARANLKAAQRAWITYRDLHCQFDTSSWEGGSFRPAAISACRQAMTKQRNKDFEAYLNCEDSPDCLELGPK